MLVVSHLGFKGGNLDVIAHVTGHCFPFTFTANNFFFKKKKKV